LVKRGGVGQTREYCVAADSVCASGNMFGDFILGCGRTATGAKALVGRGADAALKRRSSTVVQAAVVQATVGQAAGWAG